MNTINESLHDALEPLAAQVEQPMITVELRIPLRDVDFSRCKCIRTHDRYDIGDQTLYLSGYDVDFSAATFHGIPVEIPDSEYDNACDFLISQRSGT